MNIFIPFDKSPNEIEYHDSSTEPPDRIANQGTSTGIILERNI